MLPLLTLFAGTALSSQCNEILAQGVFASLSSSTESQKMADLLDVWCTSEKSSRGLSAAIGIPIKMIPVSFSFSGQSSSSRDACSKSTRTLSESSASHLLLKYADPNLVAAWTACVQQTKRLLVYGAPTPGTSNGVTISVNWNAGSPLKMVQLKSTTLKFASEVKPKRLTNGGVHTFYATLNNPSLGGQIIVSGQTSEGKYSETYDFPPARAPVAPEQRVTETVTYKPSGKPGSSVTVFDGRWGDWKNGGACKTTFICGMRIRFEDALGGKDDTAANGIRVQCCDGRDVLVNDDNPWGKWNEFASCPAGTAVCGGQVRFEWDGGRDDTALNGIKLRCCNIQPPNDKMDEILVHPGIWGDWRDWQFCPAGQFACGVRPRVESYQGHGDDTGLNGIIFDCCQLDRVVTTKVDTFPLSFSRTEG